MSRRTGTLLLGVWLPEAEYASFAKKLVEESSSGKSKAKKFVRLDRRGIDKDFAAEIKNENDEILSELTHGVDCYGVKATLQAEAKSRAYRIIPIKKPTQGTFKGAFIVAVKRDLNISFDEHENTERRIHSTTFTLKELTTLGGEFEKDMSAMGLKEYSNPEVILLTGSGSYWNDGDEGEDRSAEL